MLNTLIENGFDESYEKGSKVYPKCSSCQVAAINGVACHETGCPNTTYECSECSFGRTKYRKGVCEGCMEAEYEEY
jgi:hypothetical protein